MNPRVGVCLAFLALLTPALSGCATAEQPSAIQTAAPPADLPGEYDPDNILARAARDEIPSAKLFEDEYVLALLIDRPSSRGHFLVISKQSQARNFLELDEATNAKIVAAAKKVARAEIRALGAQGFTLRQNNGSASGVFQYHLHVIPRWAGDSLPTGRQPLVDMQTLEDTAALIRSRIDH
ncbi:MAG: HIT family protein [Parvularculaceae bacterium]